VTADCDPIAQTIIAVLRFLFVKYERVMKEMFRVTVSKKDRTKMQQENVISFLVSTHAP